MLEVFAWLSIFLAFASAAWIAVDETRHPQAMGVMNVVWPVSALSFSVAAVCALLRLGTEEDGGGDASRFQSPWRPDSGASCCWHKSLRRRVLACRRHMRVFDRRRRNHSSGLGSLGGIRHRLCGRLGRWHRFSVRCQPMRHLPAGKAIAAAIKADTLSILAFQVGMYAWMALTYFVFFPRPHLTPFSPVYWLMMQAGMICGYFTSFPMNWILLRKGLKEAM